MLIRLGLLGFLLTATIAAGAYAEAGKELPEPKAFEPIELPLPVVTEVIAKPKATTAKTAETSDAVVASVGKKTIATVPKSIVIKSDAVAHAAKMETVAAPKPAPTKVESKPKKLPLQKVAPPPVVVASAAEPLQTPASAAKLETRTPEAELGEASPNQTAPDQALIVQSQPAKRPTGVDAHPTKDRSISGLDDLTSVPVIESVRESAGQCSNSNAHRLQKSLLVMAFPRQTPNSANAGELYQVEQQVPQLLSQQLVGKHTTIAPIQLDQSLPTADTTSEAQLSQMTQRLASRHRSQFILSGEIVDMSMATPDATYNPSLFTRFVNGFFDVIEAKNRFDKRDRLFSFQLHLRDGFTGQELLVKRYDTYGIWGTRGQVGFGTPLFWKTDYGQQINGLVNLAAKDVSQAINCQPFIAQIDSRPGQTQFILQGGTNNGLRRGDTLTLHQLVIQGSETRYQEQDVRLVNRNVAIELREVYASHSVGVINSTTYLTGQLLAVSP